MPGLANDLNISESGFVTHNGSGVFHGRTLTAGTGITITNGDGISGNPVISNNGANDLHVARFIVASSTAGTGANYTTIQSAINAAAGTGIPATVFIQPGTYTENLTFADRVDLMSFVGESTKGQVTIIGTHTDGAATKGLAIGGIRFELSSGGTMFTVTNGTQIQFRECYFKIYGNSTGFSDTTNVTTGLIELINCVGDLSDTNTILFSKSGSGIIRIDNLYMQTQISTATVPTAASTVSAGTVAIYNSWMVIRITSSGTASLYVYNTSWTYDGTNKTANSTYLTFGGSGTNVMNGCYLDSGTSIACTISAATTVSNTTIKSSNASAISGASSISYGGLRYSGTSSNNAVTTQVPLVQSNDAVRITTPGAYPYTTIPQDAVILVDTSSARTITPLASPTTGQMHRIKDNVGSAATNNITITPSGKNIDGAASKVINVNYGSMDIVYNGTQWNVL